MKMSLKAIMIKPSLDCTDQAISGASAPNDHDNAGRTKDWVDAVALIRPENKDEKPTSNPKH